MGDEGEPGSPRRALQRAARGAEPIVLTGDLKLEPLVDSANKEIEPGIYAFPTVEKGHLAFNYQSELIFVTRTDEGFEYDSNIGYRNILTPKGARILIRPSEGYLRNRLRRLERDASFIRDHL